MRDRGDVVTALNPGSGDRWQLKGELHALDFQGERLVPSREFLGGRAQRVIRG